MRKQSLQAYQEVRWTPERISTVSRTAVSILLIGIIAGLFASAVHLYWLAAAVGTLLLILVVSWQFEAALALYALMAFAAWGSTPDLATGGSGTGKSLYVSEILLAFLIMVWFGKYVFNSLPRPRIRSGFYIPLGLYLAYCVFNVAHSYLFWDPHVNRIYQYPQVNALELGIRLMSAGALAMMATSVKDRLWLNRITLALLIAGSYNGLNALLKNPIPVAAPWCPLIVLLPACYALTVALDPGRSRPARGLALVGVAIAIGFVFVASISWISGWLGLFVAFGTILYLRSRRILAACIVLSLVFALVAWPFLQKNVVEESASKGDYDRFLLMQGAWRYATTFPFGVGLGNYRSYNSFYYGQKWGTTAYTSAHSTYSQHLSETGIPGLALFVAILVCGFRWILANYTKAPPGISKNYLLATAGQLAGISAAALIGDYILPTYHNGGLVSFSTTIYSWLIWGVAIAHVRITRDEDCGSVSLDSKLEHTRSA